METRKIIFEEFPPKFQSRSKRDIYELFLEKKKESKPRRKSTRDMQFLERKIYSLNCHHEEKQQIPFHLRFLSRAGRLGEKNHGDRAIIFARICWQRATQMVEPRGWSADKTQNPRLTRGGGWSPGCEVKIKEALSRPLN